MCVCCLKFDYGVAFFLILRQTTKIQVIKRGACRHVRESGMLGCSKDVHIHDRVCVGEV